MSVSAYYDDTKGFERHFVSCTPAFFKNQLFLRTAQGELKRIEVPEDAEAYAHREWLMVSGLNKQTLFLATRKMP